MLQYTFSLPTKICFGAGSVSETAQYAQQLHMKKVMLVADQGVIRAGLTQEAEESLKAARIPYVIYDKIVPNPRDLHCEEGCMAAREAGVDGLIAIGGGSSMDTAKAIGVLLTHGGHIQDWCGAGKLKQKITPLIAIPTTAGTGSEVTPFAVVTDSQTHVKLNIFDTKAAPDIALVDPSMLMGLPGPIMAATGIDALTHAVEAYTCKLAVPHTDAYAIYAVKLIARNLVRAVQERDAESCEAMMLGSTLAGIAFGYSDVAAVHCMAEALGGRYDLPHGVANAILLPTVTAYNLSADYKKYAEIAEAMGLAETGKSTYETAEACVRGLEDLCRAVGIEPMRSHKEIRLEDFPALAEAAMKNVSTPSNPKPMTPKIYEELFERAYFGK